MGDQHTIVPRPLTLGVSALHNFNTLEQDKKEREHAIKKNFETEIV